LREGNGRKGDPGLCRGASQSIGGVAVVDVLDLGMGLDTRQPDKRPALPWSPGDLMTTFSLADGSFVTLRASGTEPKLKYYLEVWSGHGLNMVPLASLAW
jgi:Phosphoglucomutase/phosphomannomutase, C-terminal domain